VAQIHMQNSGFQLGKPVFAVVCRRGYWPVRRGKARRGVLAGTEPIEAFYPVPRIPRRLRTNAALPFVRI
jgi:hypothetical protein